MESYIYSFEKLRAYQEARILVAKTYQLLKFYPTDERFALCDQMRRAVVSVTSNIAEGTGRSTYKEKLRFLEMAYGSLLELFSQFQVSFDLGYINEVQYLEMRNLIIHVAQPLSGLRSSYQRSLNDER